MPEFMLLIRGTDEPGLTPEQSKAIVAQYIAWAGKLRAENRLLGGDELGPGGKTLVGGANGTRILDGPYAETKEAIGGYFVIKADDEAHAVEIAKGCPGLTRGREVEIRAIVDHTNG
jgi:hypothetical protein